MAKGNIEGKIKSTELEPFLKNQSDVLKNCLETVSSALDQLSENGTVDEPKRKLKKVIQTDIIAGCDSQPSTNFSTCLLKSRNA